MRSFKAQLHPAPQYRRTTLPSAPLDVVTLWCGSNTLLDTTKTGTRAGTATSPSPAPLQRLLQHPSLFLQRTALFN